MGCRQLNRRGFLQASVSLLAAAAHQERVRASEPVHVTKPRATDGDEQFGPDWSKRLTLTVGPQQADLVGKSDKVIQAAVDYMARLGGGTVRILPGQYTFRNAIFLPSKVRILGSGDDTVITKVPSVVSPLSEDSDWYDQEITLKDAKGFQVGDGIVLTAKNPSNGGVEVIKRTLVAQSGNRFKLNDGIRKNLWLTGKPTASLLFPLLTSEYTSDVVIEQLTLDGNRDNNENLNGNYGGCIFLQDCNRYTIRNVTARYYNGDGISFQVCHDVTVENCHSHDHAGLGLHPGSGSQRPVIRKNRLERNNIGLFWCWGVKFGLAEDNQMTANRAYGISIGHNDTDNILRNNEVRDSGKVGILFRDDARGQNFWANRNTVEHNRIINSGDEQGVAIDITGKTRALKIVGNDIRELRSPAKRIGIRIAREAGPIELADNTIEGFAFNVVDQRPGNERSG